MLPAGNYRLYLQELGLAQRCPVECSTHSGEYTQVHSLAEYVRGITMGEYPVDPHLEEHMRVTTVPRPAELPPKRFRFPADFPIVPIMYSPRFGLISSPI